MNFGFWGKLNRPFFTLAPLADVTDSAFRRIIAKYGKPEVFWTEFVSADGLMSPGKEVLLNDLKYTEAERPIVAQLFSGHPEKMFGAAKLCKESGFDGIDINMGCPDKSVEKQCAGAALIKNPKLAKEIIRAAKSGAGDLPISVKTRTGYNKDEIDAWIHALLEEDLAALVIHLRTRKEMSLVPARWEDVARVIKLRDKLKKKTLIIGNGDVKDLKDARLKAKQSGADGVMLGRAIFGNPWLFSEKVPDIKEKLSVMVEHTKLFEELLGSIKSFAIMKKHYKAYANGFDGAKELRVELMGTKNSQDVEGIVKKFLKE
ncbi:MAG: tRNA-dihydrouridine synthase [Patescibacteria group bacterium]